MIDISAPVVAIAADAELLPPVPVPPLTSLVAPVVTAAVVVPLVVGVPLTVQLMLFPAGTVAGGEGVHAPTVTPGGKPDMAQLAFVALAVADTLLVHRIVPVYGVPTVAVSGSPVKSGAISAPVAPKVALAVLFDGLPSLLALVVPVMVVEPGAVGVPEIVQVIDDPGATLIGCGPGEHV